MAEDALGRETADVLAQLVRFNTVNPPGDERACQEWLASYLRDAGLEVELAGARPQRPNLVASLRGEADGPALGYLSHVDTVLADPADWTHDPWSGEVHDGFLWGRGALDMKQQTAAEAVAAATLARAGWRVASVRSTGASLTSALSPRPGSDACPATPRARTAKRNVPFSAQQTP